MAWGRVKDTDVLMLQHYYHNEWRDIEKVTKRNAATSCRVMARKSGRPHRVINISNNNSVYCESAP